MCCLARVLESSQAIASKNSDNTNNQDSDRTEEMTENNDGKSVVKPDEFLTVKLTNCPKITEVSVMVLSKLAPKLKLEIQACDVGFLPESGKLTET